MSRPLDTVRPIRWDASTLHLVDQRLLPGQSVELAISSVQGCFEAIRDMVVRGAPAIGITAAYGVVLSVQSHASEADWLQRVGKDIEHLAQARPTAVNLAWALERMAARLSQLSDAEKPLEAALAEASSIHQEDIDANYRIGDLGASLIKERCSILTHCNAGALATGGYGTALGVVRSAYLAGVVDQVFADETRPWLQGARLTAWELKEDGIPVSLLADGAAAWLMKQGKVGWLVVGSDRIAANGDVANKIGTYQAAIAAKRHGVKVMVAAPTSTVDMSVPSGDEIPIEQRAEEELFYAGDQRIAAEGIQAWNPVFDVTPAELVDAIVTEKGIVLEPTLDKMSALMRS